MQPSLLIALVVVSSISGSSGCMGRSSSSSTTTPPPTTTTTTIPRRVVEEEVVANSGPQNNAWGGGGNIDWSHVAPGGQQSGSNAGSVSRPSSTNTGSSNSPVAPSTPQSVSRGELRSLARELSNLDTNSVGSSVIINPQGKISSTARGDNAPNDLITLSSHRALEGQTISSLYDLLDNYNPSVTGRESDTNQELQEQESFLSAVMATPVMTKTGQFLTSKGFINRPLRQVLKEIWFTPYTRYRSTVGSSGFEHVFVGEIKDRKVSGFHNWVSFYKEEQEGDANYLGYSKTIDIGDKGSLMSLRFNWSNNDKSVGSMFVGVSPELEMALYTVCFYARQGNNCPVEINNYRFNIKTYGQNYRGKTYVGTAYPIVY